jgi:hypothetical protein
MRKMTDLLYEHFALRRRAEILGISLPPDFRKNWVIEYSRAIEL